MNKKLLLGLGTSMLLTLPLITFVSCGGNTEPGKPEPEKPPVDPGTPEPEKPTEPFVSDNLKITPNGEIEGFDDDLIKVKNLIIKDIYNGVKIKKIADWAFHGKSLTSVTFGNSITTIGIGAFQDNNITSVVISDSIVEIGMKVFANNPITSLTLGKSVTTIGPESFWGSKLTSLTIPNSVTTIGDSAFGTSNFTSLTIPDSVESIGDNAFKGSQITDRKDLILPSKFDTTEELKRIGFNFTSSSKEILLTSNGLNNYNNLMKVITVTNKFKIK